MARILLGAVAPLVASAAEPVLKFGPGGITDDTTVMLVAAAPLLGMGLCSIVFVVILRAQLMAKKTGKDIDCPRLDYLASKVKSGSIAFLTEEYKYLSVYVVFWAIVLIILFSIKSISKKDDGTDGVRCAGCFIIGAFLS